MGSMKYLCRVPVRIPAEEKGHFRVVRRIFGPGGENMKHIARESGAKLRLRGKGSGYLEGPRHEESSEPLVLCVSANDEGGYDTCIKLLTELFEGIYAQYRSHCSKAGGEHPQLLTVQVQEHPANPPRAQ